MPVLHTSLLLLSLCSVWRAVGCHPGPGPCSLTQRSAQCSNGQLWSVPTGLPVTMEELYLNHNHIQTLQDPTLLPYPSLRSLSCAGNALETIGSTFFSHSPHIESLNVAVNQLHVGYQETSQALNTLSRLRVLDLSQNGLNENMVSILLQNMSSLEHLSLSRNLILRLDESSFRGLHQIRELDLQRNMLFEIDGAFDHTNKLQRLNLAYNYLPCLVSFQMTQLVVLNASHNSIEWFIANQNLNETFSLETLDLTDNRLLFFPFLPMSSRLRNLYLSHNMLSFYEHLKSNATFHNWTTNVDFFNLKGTASNITAQLWEEDLHGDISSIDLLDLSSNQVAYFPQGFLSKMPVLSRLRMGTNCLEVLDLAREQLPGSVYELDLSNNRLTDLQVHKGSMQELSNLTYLNLSLNALQRLPRGWLSSLPSLSSVDLSGNSVGICSSGGEGGSDCVVWRNIPSLKQLSLAGCSLGRVPAAAFRGSPLSHLELSNNPQLDIRPRSLQGLSKTLQHLGLGNTGLPDFDFSPFLHLKSLNIIGNGLTHVPDSLLSLQLRVLDLRDNQLRTIPPGQASALATSLHTVYLHGNPFNCCGMDWYRTFERTKTLHIVDSQHITCQDLNERQHKVVLLDSPLCGGEEESIVWYFVLFVLVCLSLVGIAIIFLFTFRPRMLPKAIKNKYWRPTPY